MARSQICLHMQYRRFPLFILLKVNITDYIYILRARILNAASINVYYISILAVDLCLTSVSCYKSAVSNQLYSLRLCCFALIIVEIVCSRKNHICPKTRQNVASWLSWKLCYLHFWYYKKYGPLNCWTCFSNISQIRKKPHTRIYTGSAYYFMLFYRCRMN